MPTVSGFSNVTKPNPLHKEKRHFDIVRDLCGGAVHLTCGVWRSGLYPRGPSLYPHSWRFQIAWNTPSISLRKKHTERQRHQTTVPIAAILSRRPRQNRLLTFVGLPAQSPNKYFSAEKRERVLKRRWEKMAELSHNGSTWSIGAVSDHFEVKGERYSWKKSLN